MDIRLIEGEFSINEAVAMIVKMIDVKIKFHENKICKSDQEEDIKSRENKIKKLQKSIDEIRFFLNTKTAGVKVKASIHIE